MAKFDQAYKYTSAIEAGYVVDNGGPTYKGISYKGWGNDPFAKKIFAIVFAAKPRKGGFIKNAALDQLIIAFYKNRLEDFSIVQRAMGYTMSSVLTTGGIRGGKKRLGWFQPRSFNMGMSRTVFEKTNGFAFDRFAEDIEFSIRMKKARPSSTPFT